MLIENPPVQITDGLWMLGSNQYPIYFAGGGQAAAIFEGGTGPMGSIVGEQLQQLGLPREAVRQIVIPHAHPDHVMAVPRLREIMPGAEVVASQAAAKTLSFEKAVAMFCQLDDAITDSLVRDGSITEQHRRRPLTENRIPVDRTLREGDAIDVDGFTFQVLETPGHSECSLSFHDPRRKVLITSDAAGYYFQQHDYWWPNYFTGYRAYLDTIGRLAGLDAEILCRGHHGAIQGAAEIKAFLADSIAATERYHARIVEQARLGQSVRQIAERLGAEVHEKTHMLPLEFFQKNCGLMVKLSLKHEGIGD